MAAGARQITLNGTPKENDFNMTIAMNQASAKQPIDSVPTLAATILISIVGVEVFIVQPGFVQGLAQYRGLNEVEAGFIASLEMWGIAASTFVLSIFSSRLNWRYCAYLAVVLMVVANGLSSLPAWQSHFGILRSIAGLGSGVLISLGFIIMGLSAKPDRNFAVMIFWILVYAAIVFYLLPQIYQSMGFDASLVLFAGFSLIPLLVIQFLPAHAPRVATDDVQPNGNAACIAAVATLFIYFLAQGVVWAYLFLIGTAGGVAEQSVAEGLSLAQFTGIAGALFAAVAATRFGRGLPLFIGIGLSIVSLALVLKGEFIAATYIVAVCVFNLAWNMTHPYLLATLAALDSSGRLVGIGVSAQMLGLAIGPALAALVLADADSYFNVLLLAMGLFAAAGVVLVAALKPEDARSAL